MKNLVVIIAALAVSIGLSSQSIIDAYLQAEDMLAESNYEASEELLLELSHANPYNGEYNYSLGKVYLELEEYRKSITQFKRAQGLGIYYRSSFYLASNYASLGKNDSAIFYLERHQVSPVNGSRFFEDLNDSVFDPVRELEGFRNLLPPVILDSTQTAKNWITDIDYLSMMLKKTHYDPFNTLPENDWDKQIEQLKKDIPVLNEDEILVRIFQFVANLGDGHTRVLTHLPSNLKIKELPIVTRLFSDGCYIIGASEEYSDLLGAKITKVNNIVFSDVFDAVCTIMPIDNAMGYKFQFDYFFRNMTYLHGLGISNTSEKVKFEIRKDGKSKSVVIHSVDEDKCPDLIRYNTVYEKPFPLFLEYYRKGSIKWYWFKYLEDKNILYVQINGIMSTEENPLQDFCDSVKILAEGKNIDAFVLDIRNNGGGNTELNKYVLSMMLSESINIPGKSFTVLGRNTFSAAQNLTTVIENYTETIFIGEPTGSRPNFIGEIYPFVLPYCGLSVSSSNIYHQHGYSADKRIWTAPDIYVDFSFDDYINGRDPVLEEIIKFTSQ